MTVSRHRRRMSTTQALVASLIGVGLALILGVAGAVAIYNTKDGQVQGSDIPEVQFPVTPTGAIAVLDANGALASLAVVSVRPTEDGEEPGIGGTIVPVPVSADVSGGIGTEPLPLDETVGLFGPESLADEIPALLGVSIDDVAALSESDLASALAGVGPIEVTLPESVTTPDGSLLADAGAQSIDAATASAILAVRDASVSGAEDYDIDVTVWNGIASAIGAGLSAPLQIGEGSGPGSLRDTVGRLTSGPISIQTIRFEAVASVDVNPRGVDALALDRVDVAMLFGHVAPARVAAPYAGYTFRVVSGFGDSQLPQGVVRLDVAYTAVKALLETESNVRSVDTTADEAPTATVIEVANESLLPGAERLADVFGPVEVRVAGTRIAGIDMVVTLGTDYLATLDTDAGGGTTVADGSAPGGTVGVEIPISESTDTTAEGTS
jgi:hypothetical protein